VRTSGSVFLLHQMVDLISSSRPLQFFPPSDVEIVALVERRANSRTCRYNDERQEAEAILDRVLRGRLQGQLEDDGGDGNARTISVSIHIISSEFQGGGSGSGEACGETGMVSMLAHAPRTAARTGRPVRVQRFISPSPISASPIAEARLCAARAIGSRHFSSKSGYSSGTASMRRSSSALSRS
jgi:hypothetical protein